MSWKDIKEIILAVLATISVVFAHKGYKLLKKRKGKK